MMERRLLMNKKIIITIIILLIISGCCWHQPTVSLDVKNNCIYTINNRDFISQLSIKTKKSNDEKDLIYLEAIEANKINLDSLFLKHFGTKFFIAIPEQSTIFFNVRIKDKYKVCDYDPFTLCINADTLQKINYQFENRGG